MLLTNSKNTCNKISPVSGQIIIGGPARNRRRRKKERKKEKETQKKRWGDISKSKVILNKMGWRLISFSSFDNMARNATVRQREEENVGGTIRTLRHCAKGKRATVSLLKSVK